MNVVSPRVTLGVATRTANSISQRGFTMRLGRLGRTAAALSLSGALLSATAGPALADNPAGSCKYNAHASSGHCYSVITSGSLPTGVSQVSIVLRSQCMYLSTSSGTGASLFNTLWAITPNSSAYTEFGHKIQNPTPSGVPRSTGTPSGTCQADLGLTSP